MIEIRFPLRNDQMIKESVKALDGEIAARQSELEILKTMRKQCQAYCKHVGQVTGSNERDGAWGNPCPTCGFTY